MTQRQQLSLKYEILTELQYTCGLTQEGVGKLLRDTDILEFIDLSYELYHTQGIFYILQDLSEHLRERFGIILKQPYHTE